MEIYMILIYIVAFIAIATIVSVLVWFAMQDRELDGTNNGCTAAKQDISPHWPFPRNRP
jgi:hypothetical protein